MLHYHQKYFRISSICDLEIIENKRSEFLPLAGGRVTIGEEAGGAMMNEILKT